MSDSSDIGPEDIARMRDLAQQIRIVGNFDLGILLWAIVAGLSQDEQDFKKFLELVHATPGHFLRAEAIMVLIRLLLQAGNFDEARRLAADIHRMELDIMHAFARVKIAKYSGDEEDSALAMECVQELLESHMSK